jgi:hypothetical protein
MKAFLHRLHIGGGTKDKDRDLPAAQKEKFPPLRSWPPQEPQRATSTPSSFTSFKPLPELVPTQLTTQFSPRPLHPIEEPFTPESTASTPTPTPPYSSLPQTRADNVDPDTLVRATSPRQEQDSAGRSSRKTTIGSVNTTTVSDVHKKVAFISPPPTPTPTNLDRALPDAPGNGLTPALPMKTTLSRFQAAHGKEPRGSTATAASSSKTDVGSTSKASAKATSTRTASPYLQKPNGEAGSAQSLRSGTPYSQMSNSSGSRILAAQSWSEVTEEDLVSNLGSRERTRQEVLFEIISSEERYD